MNRPAVLLIMDGYGIAPESAGNAVSAAKTPNLDALFKNCPHTLLNASGRAVGLPEGQMGNSEVGHMNIGAGRIVWQDLSRISNAIDDGSFFENDALLCAMDHVKTGENTLHIFGLMSDGGVHSHIDHIKALAKMAKENGVKKLFVHSFMDGRDTPPKSGAGFLMEMEAYLKEIEIAKMGTVIGRYYAMDRDKRWERVELAYDALTGADGDFPRFKRADKAAEKAYSSGETDEFIKPRVSVGFEGIKDGDAVIFANFRPDRAREITRAFVDPSFDGFARKVVLKDLCYVCMTQYDALIPNVLLAYPPEEPENTLGEYLSKLGKKQLRIAETEKYAHVTFFLNGGREEPFEGEERILTPSPKVATYDLMPEMSAYKVTEKAAERILSGELDIVIMNLANCDMVGHTGIFNAAVKAVEAVDECVGIIAEAVKKAGGVLLLTADHGNADMMLDEDGSVFTAHSTNPVPLLLYNDAKGRSLDEGGVLCDIAATLLELMNLPIPEEMSCRSLLR